MIHETATVDPGARVGANVEIGAWSVVGPDVEIGDGTWIGSHVVVRGPTAMGPRNRIHPFCSIGGDPQDRKFAGESSRLELGSDNVIREYCTLNRGTAGGGGVTRVGDHNWIMAYVHVAHDCRVGGHTVMANGTTLAGHVTVGDHVTFGAFTVVHQFCAIGAHAFSAMGTVVLKDVPPFVTVSGNTASAHGLNREGLRRRGFPRETIRALHAAYKVVYKKGYTTERSLAALDDMTAATPEVGQFADFIRASGRGIVR